MSDYKAHVSRSWQVAIGIAALVVGVPALLIVVFCIWMIGGSSADDRTTALIVGIVFGLFGFPVTLFGARLLFAPERQQKQQLISSTGLRIAGVVILILPVIYLLAGNLFDAAFAFLHVGAAGACFAVARQRRQASRDPAEPPTAE